MRDIEQYAHVLLFACPVCQRPLSATCVSTRSNLEVAETEWFTPHCHCGWTGKLAGVVAIQHWVQSWSSKTLLLPGEPGSCDENPLSHEVR
jgi:hypothetical protein